MSEPARSRSFLAHPVVVGGGLLLAAVIIYEVGAALVYHDHNLSQLSEVERTNAEWALQELGRACLDSPIARALARNTLVTRVTLVPQCTHHIPDGFMQFRSVPGHEVVIQINTFLGIPLAESHHSCNSAQVSCRSYW